MHRLEQAPLPPAAALLVTPPLPPPVPHPIPAPVHIAEPEAPAPGLALRPGLRATLVAHRGDTNAGRIVARRIPTLEERQAAALQRHKNRFK